MDSEITKKVVMVDSSSESLSTLLCDTSPDSSCNFAEGMLYRDQDVEFDGK